VVPSGRVVRGPRPRQDVPILVRRSAANAPSWSAQFAATANRYFRRAASNGPVAQRAGKDCGICSGAGIAFLWMQASVPRPFQALGMADSMEASTAEEASATPLQRCWGPAVSVAARSALASTARGIATTIAGIALHPPLPPVVRRSFRMPALPASTTKLLVATRTRTTFSSLRARAAFGRGGRAAGDIHGNSAGSNRARGPARTEKSCRQDHGALQQCCATALTLALTPRNLGSGTPSMSSLG
jgi:hypothetical protein